MRASRQCYLRGPGLAPYPVLIFVASLPRYGTPPFVPAALALLVFLPSARCKTGEKKKKRHHCNYIVKADLPGGWIYLFGEGDRAFLRGLLDRSLLLLLRPLINYHISDYMYQSTSRPYV